MSKSLFLRGVGSGIAFVLSFGLAAHAAETPSTHASGIVARVQARFDETVDMQADVRQEVFIASLGRSETMTGTVFFKKPGKMVWDLHGEESQLIVADGKHLWFYQRDDEQVLKSTLEAVFRSSTPVSFLMGVGRIADDFRVIVKETTSKAITLDLEPKHSSADLGRLELEVDPASFDILRAKVRDPIGNVTRIEFSNLQRNLGIPDDKFAFVVPDGVDVVEAPLGY